MTQTASMSVASPEDIAEVRSSVASFVGDVVRPIVDEWEGRRRFPSHLMIRMGELGYFGATFSEQFGGTSLGVSAQCAVVEELAHGSGGISTTCLVQLLGLQPIALHGSRELQARYLEAGLRGETVAAIAVTEPNHGSNVAGIETTAVAERGSYRLSGSKMFITNAPFADVFVVAAKTDPGGGHQGISLFAVDRDTPGLEVGKHLDKMGWHTSETSAVYLDGAVVPSSCLIGELNRGFYYIMEDFNLERLLLSAQCIGLADEALRLACSYALDRRQFGQPISDFQAIRHKLARMAAELEAARGLVADAARSADSGKDVRSAAAIAKYVCAEMVNHVAFDAVGIFGGAGYMTESAVERIYRDARILAIGGGTSEIQLNIIADALLGYATPRPQ